MKAAIFVEPGCHTAGTRWADPTADQHGARRGPYCDQPDGGFL